MNASDHFSSEQQIPAGQSPAGKRPSTGTENRRRSGIQASRHRFRRQNIRRLILFVSFLAFPVTLNFLSPYLIMQGAFEGVLAGSGMMFILLLLQAFFFGRLFCAWLCPGGGINEIMSGVNNRRVTGRWIRQLKLAIWAVWLLTLIAGFVSSGGIRRFDPLYMTENGVSVDEPIKFVIYYGVILIFVLISLFAGRRASCHAICWMAPFLMLGQKLSGLMRLPRLHIQSDAAACISCERCIQQCPMSIPVMDRLGPALARDSDCILCGECVDICPKQCLKYSFSSLARMKRPSPDASKQP